MRDTADDAAGALDALDEEQLDEGAWGEPELDLGGGEDGIDDVGDGFGDEEGEDEDGEGGWEMEARPLSCYFLEDRDSDSRLGSPTHALNSHSHSNLMLARASIGVWTAVMA